MIQNFRNLKRKVLVSRNHLLNLTSLQTPLLVGLLYSQLKSIQSRILLLSFENSKLVVLNQSHHGSRGLSDQLVRL